MDEKKNKTVRRKIIFAAIFVTLAIIVEIYIALKVTFYPYVFAILLAILAVTAMYLLVSGLLEFLEIKNKKRDEQFEDTIKSQKASYILHKKYFESLEERMNVLEKAAVLPTEEIITVQKGIAKVIISRSRENTEATLSSHEQIIDMLKEFERQFNENNAGLVKQLHENNTGLMEQLHESNTGLVEQLNENNAGLVEKEKTMNAQSIEQMLEKQKEIIMSLKDMENRMNDAILQTQNVITSQIPAYIPAPSVKSEEPEMSIPSEPAVIEEEIIPEEPVILEEEIVPESEETKLPPMPDLSDPNKQMSPDEIAALFANLSQKLYRIRGKLL